MKPEQMKNKGLRQYRIERNQKEYDYAVAWEYENSDECGTHLLGSILSETPNYTINVEPRDRIVAATIIQWLGSPVGQGFVRDVLDRTHWGIKQSEEVTRGKRKARKTRS